jgi:peptide/nickel transport system substrate-binding protein
MSLRSLAATPNADKGYGAWNWGGHSSAKLDELVERSLATVDPAKRETAAREAAAQAAAEVAVIPLHYQIATWAMKNSLSYAARVDEFTFAWQFKPRNP